jgi:hypothetical protein
MPRPRQYPGAFPDFNEPLTPEDRADMDAVIAAVERGFKIAVPCRACGRWLVAAESVRHRLGKRCRERVAGLEAA